MLVLASFTLDLCQWHASNLDCAAACRASCYVTQHAACPALNHSLQHAAHLGLNPSMQ